VTITAAAASRSTRRPASSSSRAIVSKRADAPYAPGNRGVWLKVKCLYREEFVVVGSTDPEGRRPYLGALLLAYYDPDGKLVYAGRAGTGINTAELERLWRRLQPLATDKMPLDVPPPRGSRFGSPLVLSRVHWVRPELIAEVKFLTWTDDNLLRHRIVAALGEAGYRIVPANGMEDTALGSQPDKYEMEQLYRNQNGDTWLLARLRDLSRPRRRLADKLDLNRSEHQLTNSATQNAADWRPKAV
jgi:hypothetical protein